MKHAIKWYDSVRMRGWNLPNDSLYLVTGIDKTHSWGVGAFSGALPSADIGVSVKLRTVTKDGIPFSNFVSTSHLIDFRVGPPFKSLVSQENDLDPSSTAQDNSVFSCDAPFGQNQCIFVRGWRIKVRRNNLISRLLTFPPPIEISEIAVDTRIRDRESWRGESQTWHTDNAPVRRRQTKYK